MTTEARIAPMSQMAFVNAWAPSEGTERGKFWRDLIAYSLHCGEGARGTFLMLAQDTLHAVSSGDPKLQETPAVRMLTRYVEFLTKPEHTLDEEAEMGKAIRAYTQERA